MRKKRFLAVIMAASMVLGNSVAALAESVDGQLDGDIKLEGIVDPDVFDVVLPTTSANGVKDAFDFVMDPQNLIKETNGARYISTNAATGGLGISTNAFDEGTLYFANYVSENSAQVTKISPSSNELKITNKGTMDVNVAIEAKIVSLNGVELVSANSISDGDAPSVYLTLKDDKGGAGAILKDGGALEAVISGNDGAYSLSWNGTKYEKVPSANATFNDYSFYLEGASGGDVREWLELADDLDSSSAKVQVTWMVSSEEVASSPFAEQTLKITRGTLAETAVTLPAGAANITKVQFTNPNTGNIKDLAETDWKYTTARKLRFTATYIDSLFTSNIQSRVHTVTFDNGTTATITLEQ